MIKIKNLSKSFESGNNRIWAIKDINLQINKGEIFGIIGLSGAGKSTLIRCIIDWKNLRKEKFILKE